MGEVTILNLYYNWICSIAISNADDRRMYSTLLTSLWNTPFMYTLPLDENRETDGINMRYLFGNVHGYPEEVIRYEIDDRPCSVLEMMVALACRSEEQIMQDPLDGNRTSYWFMEMIETLKLSQMTNDKFDYVYFERCMTTFLNRLYLPNGYGGLFKVDNPRRDMRDTEIWYQCMWHLEEYLKKQSY